MDTDTDMRDDDAFHSRLPSIAASIQWPNEPENNWHNVSPSSTEDSSNASNYNYNNDNTNSDFYSSAQLKFFSDWMVDLHESYNDESKSERSSTRQGESVAVVDTELVNFMPQEYDIVFNDRSRTKKPGQVMMKKVALNYLSLRRFEKNKALTTMRADAPELMKYIMQRAAIDVGTNKSSRAPSMYKLETDQNGQVKYIEAKPDHLVTYVRQLQKEGSKKAKASDNSTTTTRTTASSSSSSSFLSQLRVTRLAEPEVPHHSSGVVAPSYLLPPPATPPDINSLVTLARDYHCKLKIDTPKYDNHRTQTKLLQDFLSRFILAMDENAAFLGQIPEGDMLQCLYKSIQSTLDKMYQIYQGFERREPPIHDLTCTTTGTPPEPPPYAGPGGSNASPSETPHGSSGNSGTSSGSSERTSGNQNEERQGNRVQNTTLSRLTKNETAGNKDATSKEEDPADHSLVDDVDADDFRHCAVPADRYYYYDSDDDTVTTGCTSVRSNYTLNSSRVSNIKKSFAEMRHALAFENQDDTPPAAEVATHLENLDHLRLQRKSGGEYDLEDLDYLRFQSKSGGEYDTDDDDDDDDDNGEDQADIEEDNNEDDKNRESTLNQTRGVVDIDDYLEMPTRAAGTSTLNQTRGVMDIDDYPKVPRRAPDTSKATQDIGAEPSKGNVILDINSVTLCSGIAASLSVARSYEDDQKNMVRQVLFDPNISVTSGITMLDFSSTCGDDQEKIVKQVFLDVDGDDGEKMAKQVLLDAKLLKDTEIFDNISVTSGITMSMLDFSSLCGDDQENMLKQAALDTDGKDHEKMARQVLLDANGDRVTYNGVVLRSAGMPNGFGRMGNEFGRSYEGDWYAFSHGVMCVIVELVSGLVQKLHPLTGLFLVVNAPLYSQLSSVVWAGRSIRSNPKLTLNAPKGEVDETNEKNMYATYLSMMSLNSVSSESMEYEYGRKRVMFRLNAPWVADDSDGDDDSVMMSLNSVSSESMEYEDEGTQPGTRQPATTSSWPHFTQFVWAGRSISNNPTFKLNAPQAEDDETNEKNIYATYQGMMSLKSVSSESMKYEYEGTQPEPRQPAATTSWPHIAQSVWAGQSINNNPTFKLNAPQAEDDATVENNTYATNQGMMGLNSESSKMIEYEDEETQPEPRQPTTTNSWRNNTHVWHSGTTLDNYLYDPAYPISHNSHWHGDGGKRVMFRLNAPWAADDSDGDDDSVRDRVSTDMYVLLVPRDRPAIHLYDNQEGPNRESTLNQTRGVMDIDDYLEMPTRTAGTSTLNQTRGVMDIDDYPKVPRRAPDTSKATQDIGAELSRLTIRRTRGRFPWFWPRRKPPLKQQQIEGAGAASDEESSLASLTSLVALTAAEADIDLEDRRGLLPRLLAGPFKSKRFLPRRKPPLKHEQIEGVWGSLRRKSSSLHRPAASSRSSPYDMNHESTLNRPCGVSIDDFLKMPRRVPVTGNIKLENIPRADPENDDEDDLNRGSRCHHPLIRV
jgi:hypothetical protein